MIAHAESNCTDEARWDAYQDEVWTILVLLSNLYLLLAASKHGNTLCERQCQ